MDERIVIVEDDLAIRTLLGMALKGAGYERVECAADGTEGWLLVQESRPDLVLLDVMLPGMDGLSVARRIRETPEVSSTGIIMLTARTQPSDIVRGLDAGADDYVCKPYDREVLLARVKAVLRRSQQLERGIDFDGLRIDKESMIVTVDGRNISLTQGEFTLLARLLGHRGRIMRRDADERTVDVQVANLRRKLGGWANHIETVRGIGYRVVL